MISSQKRHHFFGLLGGLILCAFALPAMAQGAGKDSGRMGGNIANLQGLSAKLYSGLTAKDRGRMTRIDESRAKALLLAQSGDPKTFSLITDILNAPAQPINLSGLSGNWRCRTFSIGGNMGPRFSAKKTGFFRCRISRSGAVFRLKKLSGSMSWLGTLGALSETQMLYSGTAIARGDRQPVYPRGDAYSHRVGRLEQVGRNRLRMEMPEPTHFAQSSHDLVEFVRSR